MGTSQSEKSQIDSAVVIMHQLVNEYRVKYGLDTLELSEVLNKRAQAHAEWMYDTKRFVHSSWRWTQKIFLKGAVWNSVQHIPTNKTMGYCYFGFNGWKSSPGA